MNLFSPMTWKSTAAVSAAGLFATWLASTPQLRPQPAAYAPSPTAAKTEAAAAEIQEQASRLHVRIQEVVAYREPSRNPFRFSKRLDARPAPARAPGAGSPQPDSEPLTSVPPRPTLLIALSGIAQDTVDGRTVRTAIISTPDGIQLVKEGDTLAGQYKVAAVGADAVELVKLSDGMTVRLGLKP